MIKHFVEGKIYMKDRRTDRQTDKQADLDSERALVIQRSFRTEKEQALYIYNNNVSKKLWKMQGREEILCTYTLCIRIYLMFLP